MDSIQSNMADGPLPVRETAKKPSKASISDSNFKLQLDMYSSQRKPSVSPSSLSEESDGVMTSGIRNEEAHVKSRSSSSSSSTNENVLAINVDDKHNEADVDSEDVLSDSNYLMDKVPNCSMLSCGLCGLMCWSFREYLHHQKNDHNIMTKIYECTICNFATLCQQKLIDHKRLNCLNTAVDSRSSSHSSSPSSTDNASLEDQENYILAPSSLNSPQRNTTCIKKEAKGIEEDNHAGPTDDNGASPSLVNTTDMAGEVFDMADEVFDKTNKKSRQEVDPNKYFEVIGAGDSKFACSQCGNKYKWKKSLNKHFKEKHSKIPFLEMISFPGLCELLRTGKYTYIEQERKLYDNSFLRTIQSKELDKASYASPPTSAHYSSHQSNKSTCLPLAHGSTFPDILQHTKSFDPILTRHMSYSGNSVASPQFPMHNNSYSPSDEDIQDLSYDLNQSSQNAPTSRQHSEDKTLSSDQEQPLDLSRNNSSSENNVPEMFRQNILASSSSIPQSKNLPQRSKSETNSETFRSFQMKKRVVTCFSCKLPLKSMDQLNDHFMTHHFQLLAKYKEAVKKIPHGLQQCYHLLDMEIIAISELGFQDLGSLDGTILTCNKCGFEAKGAADFQKHSMIHAEESLYVCMVCSTPYKNKWDLVKHFERRHEPGGLLNPYRKVDRKEPINRSSEEEKEESLPKKAKFEEEDSKMDSDLCNINSAVSLEGIVDAISGRKATSSCQQNSLDLMTKMQTAPSVYKNTTSPEGTLIEQNTDQTAPKNDQSPNISTDTLPYASHDTGTFQPNVTMGKDTTALGESKWKQFWCPECEFTCYHHSRLEKHMRTHRDEKPFKCPSPNCPYTTRWKWDVPKHHRRCRASGKSGVGKRSVINKKKGKGERKSPQSTSPSSSQSISVNASPPSNTEAQNDYPTADRKALSKKNTSDVNGSFDHNNHTAQTKDLQVTSSKQAIRVTSKKHKRSSGHIPSEVVWSCYHCPFTTPSQATLKRHSLCHSEDKPFRCDVCCYCSKWASDLKKHRRCHNHFPQINESQEVEETHEQFQPRFKCFRCTVFFMTLQELTDHYHTTHAALELGQTTVVTWRKVTTDMARITHPRKPMPYILCPQCPFNTTSRHTMAAHLDEDIHCHYCRCVFEKKHYFFEHLITHGEFTPKEWEPYFILSDTEQQPTGNAKTIQRADYKPPGTHIDARGSNQNNSQCKDDNEKSVVDSSLVTRQPVVAAGSGHILASQKRLQLSMHTCDWCLEEFASLTAVYEHARQHHLYELTEQALEMAVTVDASP